MCHGGLPGGGDPRAFISRTRWPGRQAVQPVLEAGAQCCSEGVGEATGASILNLAREQRHSRVMDELN